MTNMNDNLPERIEDDGESLDDPGSWDGAIALGLCVLLAGAAWMWPRPVVMIGCALAFVVVITVIGWRIKR